MHGAFPIIKLLAVSKLTFIAINDNIDGLILSIGQLGVLYFPSYKIMSQ